jgi:hypothetical protein
MDLTIKKYIYYQCHTILYLIIYYLEVYSFEILIIF